VEIQTRFSHKNKVLGFAEDFHETLDHTPVLLNYQWLPQSKTWLLSVTILYGEVN